MLKYGFKIWSVNKPWFSQAITLQKKGKIDFIELYLVPGSFCLKDLKIFKDIPTAIHSPHFEHNFNIFEINKDKIKLFQELVIKSAEFLDSQFIIVHAGLGENQETFKKNINRLADLSHTLPGRVKPRRKVRHKRLLIENMTKIGIDGRTCFGYSSDQLEFIKKECGFDICFDFAHAAKAALSQKLPYKDFIKKIIETVKPCYFHLCGTYFNSQTDEHQNLFEGDLDMKWAKKILVNLAEKRDIYLVFEVPKINGFENDLKNIEYFKCL